MDDQLHKISNDPEAANDFFENILSVFDPHRNMDIILKGEAGDQAIDQRNVDKQQLMSIALQFAKQYGAKLLRENDVNEVLIDLIFTCIGKAIGITSGQAGAEVSSFALDAANEGANEGQAGIGLLQVMGLVQMGLPLVKTVLSLVSDSNGSAGATPIKIYQAPIGTNQAHFIDAARRLYRKTHDLPENANIQLLNKYNIADNLDVIYMNLRSLENAAARPALSDIL